MEVRQENKTLQNFYDRLMEKMRKGGKIIVSSYIRSAMYSSETLIPSDVEIEDNKFTIYTLGNMGELSIRSDKYEIEYDEEEDEYIFDANETGILFTF